MMIDWKNTNLKVVSIHRQSVIDAAYVCKCEHCGQTIVNVAVVEDTDTGKQHNIGLDCKKTLIDNKVLAWVKDKHEIKEYKTKTNRAQKFLLYLGQSEKYDISSDGSTIYVADKTKECFPNTGIMGKTIDSENLGYLFNIGMKDFLQECVNKGIIKYHA